MLTSPWPVTRATQFLDRLVCRRQGRRVQKKSPVLLGRLGILPAFTLHSLILEDFPVKDIQTRFSDSPALPAAFPSGGNLLTVANHLLKGSPFPF